MPNEVGRRTERWVSPAAVAWPMTMLAERVARMRSRLPMGARSTEASQCRFGFASDSAAARIVAAISAAPCAALTKPAS